MGVGQSSGDLALGITGGKQADALLGANGYREYYRTTYRAKLSTSLRERERLVDVAASLCNLHLRLTHLEPFVTVDEVEFNARMAARPKPVARAAVADMMV